MWRWPDSFRRGGGAQWKYWAYGHLCSWFYLMVFIMQCWMGWCPPPHANHLVSLIHSLLTQHFTLATRSNNKKCLWNEAVCSHTQSLWRMWEFSPHMLFPAGLPILIHNTLQLRLSSPPPPSLFFLPLPHHSHCQRWCRSLLSSSPLSSCLSSPFFLRLYSRCCIVRSQNLFIHRYIDRPFSKWRDRWWTTGELEELWEMMERVRRGTGKQDFQRIPGRQIRNDWNKNVFLKVNHLTCVSLKTIISVFSLL